eukprot:436191-Pleurochrysis_carterae.AAC.2
MLGRGHQRSSSAPAVLDLDFSAASDSAFSLALFIFYHFWLRILLLRSKIQIHAPVTKRPVFCFHVAKVPVLLTNLECRSMAIPM